MAASCHVFPSIDAHSGSAHKRYEVREGVPPRNRSGEGPAKCCRSGSPRCSKRGREERSNIVTRPSAEDASLPWLLFMTRHARGRKYQSRVRPGPRLGQPSPHHQPGGPLTHSKLTAAAEAGARSGMDAWALGGGWMNQERNRDRRTAPPMQRNTQGSKRVTGLGPGSPPDPLSAPVPNCFATPFRDGFRSSHIHVASHQLVCHYRVMNPDP